MTRSTESVRRQCHHRDHADAEAGECDGDELPGIGQLDENAVVVTESVLDEPEGGAVDALEELPVGQSHRAVDDRDCVRGAIRSIRDV